MLSCRLCKKGSAGFLRAFLEHFTDFWYNTFETDHSIFRFNSKQFTLFMLDPRRYLSKAKAFFAARLWPIAKKHPKKSIAAAAAGAILLLLIFGLTRPKAPEYVTEDARRGDLLQTVEAVGNVISERDLKLQFPITGIVDKVFVDEGDRVKAGQELARLRSSGLSADVASASAAAAAARADLDRMLEGTRPEEIAITEASVANKRAALETAKESLRSAENNLASSQQKLTVLQSEAKTGLSGYVQTARSDISRHIATADSALRVLDDVFNDNRVNDVYQKHEAGRYYDSLSQVRAAQAALNGASRSAFVEYKGAIEALEQARATVADVAYVVSLVYSDVSTLPVTPAYSSDVRSDIKAQVSAEQDSVDAALSSLDSAVKNLRDASASYDTRIAAEEAAVTSAQGSRDRALSDIQTYETSLRIEEAQLSLQKAGSRKSDIDAARARLNQQYASLQRARERYEDTVIRAPIDGIVTKVNLKEGELLSTSFASDTAVTMLGDTPYRIEMFVSEIDVPRVRIGQSGSVLLDAFPGRPFWLTVSELDPTATEVDGVSKYRAKLDFEDETDALKIGMTGDSEIYTDFRENVIIIPGRAVSETDEKKTVRILEKNGSVTDRTVETGMEGADGEVEVISGVSEGETVIVLEKK